jgi:hypothetical protein
MEASMSLGLDRTAQWVEKQIQAARDKHQDFYDRSDRVWHYYRFGEPEVITKYRWQSKVVVNIIRPAVENEVAVGTDARLEAQILPRDMDDEERARELNACVAHVFDDVQIEELTEHWFRHLLVPGLAWAYVGWDPYKGDVEIRQIDARRMDWDPDCDSVTKARWVCETSYLPILIAEALYPEFKGRFIRVDPEEAKEVSGYEEVRHQGNFTWTVDGNEVVQSGVYSPRPGEEDEENRGLAASGLVRMRDLYMVPGATMSEGTPTQGEGQRILTASGAGTIYEGPSPFNDTQWNPLPYIPLVADDVLDKELRAVGPAGMVEQLIPIQRQFGRLFRQVCDHAHKNCRGYTMVDKASNLKKRDFGDPENFVEYRAMPNAEKPYVLAPPQLSNGIMELFPLILRLRDMVAMMGPTDQGEVPGDVTAASAIRMLQRVTERGARVQIRRLERFLKGIGSRTAYRIAQNWTTERMVRLAVPGGETESRRIAPQQLPMLNEMGEQMTQPVLDEMDQPVLDEMGEQVEELMTRWASRFEGLEIDYEVKVGSTLPPDRESLIKLGMELTGIRDAWGRPLVDWEQFMRQTPYTKNPDFGVPPPQQPGMPGPGGPEGGAPGPGGVGPPPSQEMSTVT